MPGTTAGSILAILDADGLPVSINRLLARLRRRAKRHIPPRVRRADVPVRRAR